MGVEMVTGMGAPRGWRCGFLDDNEEDSLLRRSMRCCRRGPSSSTASSSTWNALESLCRDSKSLKADSVARTAAEASRLKKSKNSLTRLRRRRPSGEDRKWCKLGFSGSPQEDLSSKTLRLRKKYVRGGSRCTAVGLGKLEVRGSRFLSLKNGEGFFFSSLIFFF